MRDIQINLDSQSRSAADHCAVAAALVQNGNSAIRTSVTGEPRGPLCGMGICFECRATIDGRTQLRTCQTLCEPGMKVERDAPQQIGAGPPPVHGEGLSPVAGHVASFNPSAVAPAQPSAGAGPSRPGGTEDPSSLTHEPFDVLVVGAGPAGLAAACRAAEGGARVGVVDDNPRTGGQIWRGGPAAPVSPQAAEWFKRIDRCRLTILSGTQVVAANEPGSLLANHAGSPLTLRYKRLILATGARELFLPFPGWTLPNVMGAGGLQAMVKSGLDVKGKRILLAGSGPLLLAVAEYLKRKGATIVLVAEQAPLAKLAAFGLRLLTAPAKLRQAVSLRRGIKLLTGTWPLAASGNGHVEAITLTNGSRTWTEPCDYVGCGFGLIPNTELAALLGCRINHGTVAVDALQRTSVENIYAVGEATGIGGLDMALVQGQIAGLSAIDRDEAARGLFKPRRAAAGFARAMNRTFSLRDELRKLPAPDTYVCRCEDVTFARLLQRRSWLDAKLQTRCGMGPCQGRVCGAAAAFLFQWEGTSVRPPVLPVELQALRGD